MQNCDAVAIYTGARPDVSNIRPVPLRRCCSPHLQYGLPLRFVPFCFPGHLELGIRLWPSSWEDAYAASFGVCWRRWHARVLEHFLTT
jgi:hypothetical protein